MSTMCEKCLHYGVCSIRDCYDADDELALVYCADYISNEGVVLKAECGAECPTCHGTGKIGTTDWLTKHLTKEQLAEEKEKANKEAIEELEQKAKQEVASKVIDEFKNLVINYMTNKDLLLTVFKNAISHAETELKKKYIGETK